MSAAAGDDRRVCLLTGAGGELGSAFCRRHGGRYAIAAVCRTSRPDVCDQDSEYVDPLRPGEPLEGEHPGVFALTADLARQGEVERVVELTLARFGHIDLLVNAAAHSVWAPVVESNALLASLERQFEVNVFAPLRLAATVAREHWRDRRAENEAANRNVVNVSSIAGVYVYPDQGQSVYSATKAALNNLTCHLADEFAAFGVRVNATAPDSFPSLLATEDVADSIVRLDEGDMTGRIVVMAREGERVI